MSCFEKNAVFEIFAIYGDCITIYTKDTKYLLEIKSVTTKLLKYIYIIIYIYIFNSI